MRDPLQAVVDNDGKLVGEESVGAFEHEVTDIARKLLLLHALQAVMKGYDFVGDCDAPGAAFATRGYALTTCPRIDALAGLVRRRKLQLSARARTGKRHPTANQII